MHFCLPACLPACQHPPQRPSTPLAEASVTGMKAKEGRWRRLPSLNTERNVSTQSPPPSEFWLMSNNVTRYAHIPISLVSASNKEQSLFSGNYEKDHERSQEGYGVLKISADIESHYENTNDPSQPEKMFNFSLYFGFRFSQEYLQCQRHKEINKVTRNLLETVRWGKMPYVACTACISSVILFSFLWCAENIRFLWLLNEFLSLPTF